MSAHVLSGGDPGMAAVCCAAGRGFLGFGRGAGVAFGGAGVAFGGAGVPRPRSRVGSFSRFGVLARPRGGGCGDVDGRGGRGSNGGLAEPHGRLGWWSSCYLPATSGWPGTSEWRCPVPARGVWRSLANDLRSDQPETIRDCLGWSCRGVGWASDSTVVARATSR